MQFVQWKSVGQFILLPVVRQNDFLATEDQFQLSIPIFTFLIALHFSFSHCAAGSSCSNIPVLAYRNQEMTVERE